MVVLIGVVMAVLIGVVMAVLADESIQFNEWRFGCRLGQVIEHSYGVLINGSPFSPSQAFPIPFSPKLTFTSLPQCRSFRDPIQFV